MEEVTSSESSDRNNTTYTEMAINPQSFKNDNSGFYLSQDANCLETEIICGLHQLL
jgi:hypothetical protein